MRGSRISLVLVAVFVGCKGGDKAAPDTAAASSAVSSTTAIVAQAEIPAATFDTVIWQSEAAAVTRGADVFKWACARCHGPKGRGNGGAVVQGDTIHPPSFLEGDWRFANDPMGLRRKIYMGNNRGMPHWGDLGLQARDVVALELYIRKSLRTEKPTGT
jgi:cytochrome c